LAACAAPAPDEVTKARAPLATRRSRVGAPHVPRGRWPRACLAALERQMKVFACSACGHALFFENVQCNGCGRRLAYVPDRAVVSPLEAAEAQAVAARPD